MTRSGSEADLEEELSDAVRVSEGVVLCERRPKGPDGRWFEPTFARQALQNPKACRDAAAATAALRGYVPKTRWALQVVAPDSTDPEDPRRPVAAQLEEQLRGALPAETEPRDAQTLLQAWIVDEDRIWVGATPVHEALSRWPGGKVLFRRDKDAVSRAGLKLEEAIDWAGLGPDRGDIVADLGAAPGGWSQVLIGLGCTVVAVDPKELVVRAPPKRLAHLKQSAFTYAPPETLDWVVCDMAYRPLEVAKLLAKWARRSWARQLISNIKLPMKQKVAVLEEIRAVLEEAGWEGLRMRQLFFDRDEITLYAHLSPRLAARPAQAPFSKPRSKPRAGRRGGARRGPRAGKRKTSIKRR